MQGAPVCQPSIVPAVDSEHNACSSLGEYNHVVKIRAMALRALSYPATHPEECAQDVLQGLILISQRYFHCLRVADDLPLRLGVAEVVNVLD